MNIVLSIFFLGFGAIIGSFLNVVLYRYNTGKGIGGRSQCFSCKRELSAVDLVPVLSYVSFGGKCRTCQSEISAQYPAVEILTALLFFGTYAVFSPAAKVFPEQFLVQAFYTCIIMSFLVLIIVYDIRHKIIPDFFSYSFAFLSLITLFLGFDEAGRLQLVIPSLSALSAGVILAFPFYVIWLVSDGRWMGLGDAKLALGIGWFLGLSAGATAVIFGFWVGAFVSVALLGISYASGRLRQAEHVRKASKWIREAVRKSVGFQLPPLTFKSEIPFAPFLIAGLLIVFFFGYNLFGSLDML